MLRSLVALLFFCGLNSFAQVDEVREPQAVPDVPPAAEATVNSKSDTTLVKAKTPEAETSVKKELTPDKVTPTENPIPAATPAPVATLPETKPTPVPEVAVAAQPKATESKSKIGFYIAAGIPHPETGGIDYLSASKKFGFSILGGQYHQKVQSDTEVSIRNAELQFHYHPWATAFYLGLGAGSHVIKGDKTVDISGITAKASVEVNATYLTPQFGWIANWDNGFTLGFQVGWLAPTGSTTDVSSDATDAEQATPEYQSAAKDIKDKASKIGDTGLPYVTLLRLGWLF